MTQRVTDEQARILADGDYEPVVQIGIGTTINVAHLASDLLAARAEIASLRATLAAVCRAGETLMLDVDKHSTGAFLSADDLYDTITAAGGASSEQPIQVKGAEMKRLIEETEDDGFSPLMGEVVTLLCANYFYTGKLVGVNADFVELEDPAIVYETGEWTAKEYKDVQALGCKTLRVRVAAIEAYGIIK